MYEGVFGANGKLTGAKAGTRATPELLKQASVDRRESDRVQVDTIQGLSGNIQGLSKGAPSGGLSGSKLSFPHAENLVAEPDQEFEGGTSGASADSPVSGQNAKFLDLLS